MEAMADTREDMRLFFKQSLEQKAKCERLGRGYSKVYEHYRNVAPNEPVECFFVGAPPGMYCGPMNSAAYANYLPNIFPTYPRTAKDNLERYWLANRATATCLLRSVSMALGLHEDFLTELCDTGPHISKVNFYPVMQKILNSEPRVLEHTDHTLFTILTHMDATPKALQVQKRNSKEWLWADPVDGTAFINVGDFLEEWSHKRFVSTVHRVDWPREGKYVHEERLSHAYFVIPNVGAKFRLSTNCLDSEHKENLEKEYTYAEYSARHKARIKPSGW